MKNKFKIEKVKDNQYVVKRKLSVISNDTVATVRVIPGKSAKITYLKSLFPEEMLKIQKMADKLVKSSNK